MCAQQGDLALLQHPVAQELLSSKIPARVAYIAPDGTPRVLPIWFHWTGSQLVLGTPPNAAKAKALAKNSKVAVTIDDNQFPHKVLLIRGTAHLDTVSGIVPEYAAAAERYFGAQQGQAWVKQLRAQTESMVRIAITPEWVGLIDFQTRFPATLSKR
jgi:PPOX class probable F420-dependent enzyme